MVLILGKNWSLIQLLKDEIMSANGSPKKGLLIAKKKCLNEDGIVILRRINDGINDVGAAWTME